VNASTFFGSDIRVGPCVLQGWFCAKTAIQKKYGVFPKDIISLTLLGVAAITYKLSSQVGEVEKKKGFPTGKSFFHGESTKQGSANRLRIIRQMDYNLR